MAILEPGEIVRALATVAPMLVDPNQRRALVWLATEEYSETRAQLNWEGPPEVFLLGLISSLPDYESVQRTMLALSRGALKLGDEDGLGLRGAHSDANSHIRVFVSSPSDVLDERAVAMQVVQQLAYDPLVRGRLTTEVVAWDMPNRVPLVAGIRPQASIDRSALAPESCDIVVVILWSRTGTTGILGSGETGTEEEYRRSLESFRRAGRPTILVYRRTEPAWVQLGAQDLEERRQQWSDLQGFLARIAEDSLSQQATVNDYESTATFKMMLELHLRELIRQFWSNNGISPQPAEHGSRLVADPYPGLRPFAADDNEVFFGRDHEVDELIERLSRNGTKFLIIVGASGSGKSSLVHAGLLPRVRMGAVDALRDARVISFTPDQTGAHDPYHALHSVLDIQTEYKGPFDPVATLRHQDCILVIDQLEEVFTSAGPSLAESFLDHLLAFADESGKYVIATMRADFFEQLLSHGRAAVALKEGTYPLPSPGYSSLFEMIAKPALVAGITLERGLPERLLADTGTEPGALALMAFTLNALVRGAEVPSQLTLADYESVGAVKGALARQAEAAYASVSEAAKGTFGALFRGLVTVNDDGEPTRRRTRASSLPLEGPMGELVASLIGARILMAASDSTQRATLEVAHEAVFHSWPMIEDWIEHAQEDLRTTRDVERACREWLRLGRPSSHLWADERISSARLALDRLSGGMVPNTELAAFLTPERTRLEQELQDAETPLLRRALIGEMLAELGDLRPGVGTREDGLPDIVWCGVGPGRVRLDGLAETLDVAAFEISKFPVTCGQFEAFVVADDGYDNLAWWDAIPRQGEPPTAHHRLPNHPMESVSWYEAVAFCRWLSDCLHETIRLPTEAEWQFASAGTSNCRFPWGREWRGNFANTAESGLARTIAVGLFPHGRSAAGAMDMAGNVWEWCLNTSKDPRDVEIREAEQRAVRGGCWYHPGIYASCSFRNPNWDYAAPRSQLRGFRLVRVAAAGDPERLSAGQPGTEALV